MLSLINYTCRSLTCYSTFFVKHIFFHPKKSASRAGVVADTSEILASMGDKHRKIMVQDQPGQKVSPCFNNQNRCGGIYLWSKLLGKQR
jgi:hypothetical protein